MSSTSISSHADKAAAACQKLLGANEPVVAASCGIWTGQWGAMAAMQAIPILGMYLRSKGKRASGGLPQRFIVCLTDQRLIVFNQPKSQLKGWEIVAKSENRSWPRAGLTIQVADAPSGKAVTFTPAGGDAFVVNILDNDAADVMGSAIS